MINKKLRLLSIMIVLLSIQAEAQFRDTATLEPVKETGFYHIDITPELSSYLKTDLSDLRISNGRKQMVPYVMDIPIERENLDPELFNHKIVSRQQVGSNTVLIIENEKKDTLSSFIIGLKSAAAERNASLSGSDDNSNWFVVIDSLLLKNPPDYTRTTYFQDINFPPSAYRFFKLTINNGEREPLNILHIQNLRLAEPKKLADGFFNNPLPKFSQREDGTYSVITILSGGAYHMNYLRLGIAGPWFYERYARIFTHMDDNPEDTWHSTYVMGFTISSEIYADRSFPFIIKADTLYLLIKNGDNPPLKVTSIQTKQVIKRVIFQLEKDSVYHLLLNDPSATAPKYDLEHFKDKIPPSKPVQVKAITALAAATTVADTKQTGKWWIWPALLAVIALLSLLAWKLTADMKKGAKVTN